MKHTTLEKVLTEIRRQSDRQVMLQKPSACSDSCRIRVEQITGMLELVTLLGYADYPIPAILYGFLKSEVERLKRFS